MIEQAPSQRSLAVAAMLGAVLIYGATFPFSRHATQHGLTPHDLTALRFLVAGLLLLPLFVRAGWRNCAGIGWGRGALIAASSGVPMVFLMNTGLSLAPAAHGASIQPGTVTVIGAVGSMILFGARPSPAIVVGIAVVLSGLACIGLAGTVTGSSTVVLGDLCFLAAGSLWGLYPLLLQRWAVPPLVATAIVAVLSLAYLPLYALWLEPRILTADTAFVLAHGFNQGVLNVIAGLWLWGYAVRVLGAAVAQRFPPLIPVIGTMLSIPILGEWPGALQSIGVAGIVLGLLLAAFGDRLIRHFRGPLTAP
ncbi:MAG TPA: DMT family transporter [Beijerinckiaceae bacterium]|jgi:drug/metabolite transporter (DMT)-like permease